MNTPDLSSYRAVHLALGTTPHRLAAAGRGLDPADAARIRALRRYWTGFVGEITAHHSIEDDFVFPALVEKVPMIAPVLDEAGQEHVTLDDLMAEGTASVDALGAADAASVARFVAAMDALADHMDEHLDLEDADVLPMIERHFSAEEYEVLDQAAMKSLGLGKQALFTIPFVLGAVSPEEGRHLLDNAPGAFRVLWVLTRRRFARLERLALGADVPVTV